MENLTMNLDDVQYIDDDKISIVFLSIVIRVDSINKLYPGGLKEFIKHELIYGVCNGRLFIFSEMMSEPNHIAIVYDQLLKPNGFIKNNDFVIGLDERFDEKRRGKPLEWCNVRWLKSEITPNGNFVWHIDSNKGINRKNTEKQMQNGGQISPVKKVDSVSFSNSVERARIVEIDFEGQTIIGKVNRHEKFAINVSIISPYKNWDNGIGISGPGQMSPYHFFTERGEVVINDLLTESYRKLKIIDESIDRICKVYENLKEEIIAVDDIKDDKLKTRIKSKLNDWFFRDFLFTSSVTGLMASVFEEDKVKQILEEYLKSGKKIYQE